MWDAQTRVEEAIQVIVEAIDDIAKSLVADLGCGCARSFHYGRHAFEVVELNDALGIFTGWAAGACDVETAIVVIVFGLKPPLRAKVAFLQFLIEKFTLRTTLARQFSFWFGQVHAVDV